jgi:hypothetical protein
MPEQEAANLQDSSVSVEDAVTGITTGGDIDDPGDFFAQLDEQVNGSFTESPPPPQEQITSEKSPVAEETTDTTQVSKLERLEKRYSDSSREAKRLNNRLQELEPYAPLLDRMREDPNLISTVRDHINGENQPKGMKERLGLDEDFVFDSDEAFSDPNSDSAKVFNSVVNDRVKGIVGKQTKVQNEQAQRSQMEKDFKEKYELDNEQWEKFVNYANSRQLTFDDIYYLMNRENRDQKVANETRKQVANQMQNVRQKPQSFASSGEQSTNPEDGDVNDAVFDSILKVGMDDIFN